MSTQSNLKKRWLYLAAGVFAMLFSGVLYAWSILKVPFKEDFGFGENVLSLNFTLTMCFFCLGAFFGSLICKKIGVKITLVIAGLCLTGLSYGSCPTLTSAFTSSFYGQKYFSVNYSLTNFNLIVAAFIANFSNSLLAQYGSYTAPFTMLLILAVCALGLNVSVKKP